MAVSLRTNRIKRQCEAYSPKVEIFKGSHRETRSRKNHEQCPATGKLDENHNKTKGKNTMKCNEPKSPSFRNGHNSKPDEAAPSFENSSDDDCSDTDEEPFERNEYPSEKLHESYENMRKDPDIQASLKSLVEKRNKQGSQSKRSGAGE